MDFTPTDLPESPEKTLARSAVDAAQPEGKRTKVTDADDENIGISTKIVWEIYNLDPVAMIALLGSDLCKDLTLEQKSQLHERASKQESGIKELSQKGAELTAQATNMHVKQRFSYNEELHAIKRIKAQLDVFKYLKNLRFPQALFSPRPYHKGLRPSLNTVLEAFIMGEQEAIASSCFHLTFFDVARKLWAKRSEGVNVELVTNQNQGENPPLQALEALIKNGVNVYCPKDNKYEENHHKFFVFTKNITDKPLVWMGSYNPTGHANENSWDDVMLVDDLDVIQDYIDRFAQIKTASQQLTLKDLKGMASNPRERSLRNNNVPQELWNQSVKIFK